MLAAALRRGGQLLAGSEHAHICAAIVSVVAFALATTMQHGVAWWRADEQRGAERGGTA